MTSHPPRSNRQTKTDADESRMGRLIPQLRAMARALVRSPVRARLLWLALSLLAVIGATAYGQIRLNQWNRPFYDALSHRELRHFLRQLGVFGVIAASLLALNVAQQWLSQMFTLTLREGLVHDLVHNWLLRRRAFRLAHAGPIGVNPDQRMHEDARHLTELSASLGIGLLQASVLLFVFVGVLWSLSSDFTLRLGGRPFAIPGYMVWAATIYACSASLLSYWVGHGLVSSNAARYAREADLRFSLVRVNEHIDAIALAHGEADEERRIDLDLAAVLTAMRRLVTGLTNLTWVTAGYGWFTLIAPILAAAPLYFTGSLSFGGLMMAAGAFNQVQSSMRWFVDNFSSIADWRATLLRVANFRRAVINCDRLHSVADRIAFSEGEPGKLRLENLQITSPSGSTSLEDPKVEIRAGEHVLIVGQRGVGKTLLFRTLAGLWPWGSGRIVRPRGEEFWYAPRRGYLPSGTLHEVLAYPMKVEQFDAQACERALQRCELGSLVSQLEVTDRWDHRLAEDALYSLLLARLLLHAPRWVIVDDLFDSLTPEALERLLGVFAHELAGSALIHIGTAFARHSFFPRVVHLGINPAAARLDRQTAVAA